MIFRDILPSFKIRCGAVKTIGLSKCRTSDLIPIKIISLLKKKLYSKQVLFGPLFTASSIFLYYPLILLSVVCIVRSCVWMFLNLAILLNGKSGYIIHCIALSVFIWIEHHWIKYKTLYSLFRICKLNFLIRYLVWPCKTDFKQANKLCQLPKHGIPSFKF